MTDQEKKLLIALVKMVDQYLDKYEGEVDSKSMSAGEHAIEALADFGLMENQVRFGRWTERGRKFLTEAQGWDQINQTLPDSAAQLVSNRARQPPDE